MQGPSRTLYLVGDRIKAQLPDPGLLSISELEVLIDTARVRGAPASTLCLRIGQGASAERLREARQRVDSYGLAEWIQIPSGDESERAPGVFTHKRQVHNIIISEPQQRTSVDYVATLLVDESCAEMSDHLSGKHVQGMVLIEAARQMVLAVGEKFFISTSQRGQRSFVTHRMEAQFDDFILPLAVEIRCHIDSLRRGSDSNFKATATISFHQAGARPATVRFMFSVLDKKFLEAQETRLVERQIPAATVTSPSGDRAAFIGIQPACTL